MRARCLISMTCLVGATACATQDPPPRIAEPPAPPVIAAPTVQPAEPVMLQNPVPPEPPRPVVTGIQALTKANREARQEIRSDQLKNAKWNVPYVEGQVVPVRVPRTGHTVIRFQPDEQIDNWIPPKKETVHVDDSYGGQDGRASDILYVWCDEDDDGKTAHFTAWTTKGRDYLFDVTCQSLGNRLIAFQPTPGTDGALHLGRPEPRRPVGVVRAAPLENLDCTGYQVTGRIGSLTHDMITICTDGRATLVSLPSGTPVIPVLRDLHPGPQPKIERTDNPVSGRVGIRVDRRLEEAELKINDEIITIRRIR